MRALKLLAVCLASCLVVSIGWVAPALANGTLSSEEKWLANPALVVPAAQLLLGGEQLRAQREAELANPTAVEERRASRTRFEHMDAAAAAKLAASSFPQVVDRPAGGPPSLPGGEKIVSYVASNAAQISLPGGHHGVIESLQPMAIPSGGRHFKPIELGLRQAGNGYAPTTSDVTVQIPKQLSSGISLPAMGVTVTPVDANGNLLEGSAGTLDGSSVLYANTQTDTDTLVKPTTGGAQVDALLRSVNSPEELYFKIGMPVGARLVLDKRESGARVVLEGVTIATVTAPMATDAAGTDVPLRVRVQGSTLILTAMKGSAEYDYPIQVDPIVKVRDLTLGTPLGPNTNWQFHATASSKFEFYNASEGVVMRDVGSFVSGEHDEFEYEAHGQASLVDFDDESAAGVTEQSGAITKLEFAHGVTKENETTIGYAGVSFAKHGSFLCASPECEAGTVNQDNEARFMQTATAGAGGEYYFWAQLYNANVGISQEASPEAEFNTTEANLSHDEGRQNVLYGSKAWLSERSGAFEIITKDPGLGVSHVRVHELLFGSWEQAVPILAENRCAGVWCSPSYSTHFTYGSAMTDGEKQIELCAEDAAHLTGCKTAALNVDNTPPATIKLKGMAESGAELSAAPHQVTVEAVDGTFPTRSSGVKMIAVSVDGVEIGSPAGSCAPGECTASSTRTINGESLGAGEHKLSVTATDFANNAIKKEFTFAIRNATPMPLGPGTLDPVTGQLALSTSDVNVAGVGGITRTYLSRSPSAGSESPLGSQWTLGIGAGQSLKILPNGNAELRSSTGGRTTFASNKEGGLTSPKGDESLTLQPKEKEAGHGITEYLLKNETAAITTRFTLPSGSSVWVPSSTEGAAPSETTRYSYRSAEAGKITEPTEILGPMPTGVSCGKNPGEVKLEELKPGCRALSFTYAEKTTATGESSGSWGEYTGRLSKVSFTGYNPTTKVMQTTALAQYSYDSQSRLRAEWDPRISPALKTTYGYDSEGHVVAVSPPGQQPWLIHYGMIAGDIHGGRVLSVIRSGASTALGNGSPPVNTAVPTLSTASPAVGATLSVSSNGTWSNSPLTYSYQWEDCNGAQCTAIAGAVNQSYTPQARDAGYTLVAQVTGQNANGAVTASTAASKVVPISAPSFSVSYGSGALNLPDSVAIASNGSLWVSDSGNNRLEEFSSSGTFIEAIGWGVTNNEAKFQICTSSCHVGIKGSGAGQFYSPAGIAINQSTGNIYEADATNSRIQQFNEKGEFIRSFGVHGTGPGQLEQPNGLAIDAAGNLWVVDTSNARIEEYSAAGGFMYEFGSAGSGNGQLSSPMTIAVSGEHLYVVEYGNSRVQEFTTAGIYLTQWGKKGSSGGEYEFQDPFGIGVDPVSGDVYVSDCLANRVLEYNQSGIYVNKFGSTGSEAGKFNCPDGMTFDTSGNVYIADYSNSRVDKWTPTYSTNNPAPTPPAAGSNSITTVEYGVPLYGSSAPNQMTTTEMARWGQKGDLPVEATAIFPPDEPMGWPASSYKRASTTYIDAQVRTVNTATPSGAISTMEYNTVNEVTRSLSAANRTIALKEGSKSAEVAEALSTEKIYGPEGTQLIETYGPEHKVRLATGVEEETRNRQTFSYDEGDPGEEAHDLVTKSASWSETASKKILAKHESVTSYNGPNQVGWKLRKPTLVTSVVEGQTRATTTRYQPETGEAKETFTSVSAATPMYASQFGVAGTGSGQLKAPSAAATDSHGDVWVVDHGNNRIEEFSALGQFMGAYGSEGTGAVQFKGPEGIAINQTTGNVYVSDAANNRIEELSAEGKFVATFGFGVSNGEAKYQICTSACRAGVSGAGSGQLNDPVGIAVDPNGNTWVVDHNNNRIEKFSSANAFVSSYGSSGTGEAQFKEPAYIAVSGGNLYVTDSGNVRVQELSTSGAYISQFGSSGSGNGQFSHPQGIAASPGTGTLYVGDPTNSRVEEFTQGGMYVAQFGTAGTGNGQLKTPVGLAASGSNEIYAVDSGNSRVEMWERPLPDPVYSSAIGTTGSEAEKLVKPAGGAVDAHGNLWVTSGWKQLDEFSPAGAFMKASGSSGTGAGQFKSPSGVAVNQSTGNIYIGDEGNNRVDELNEKGEFVRTFGFGVSNGEAKFEICTSACQVGIGGSGSGQLDEPQGVAIDSSGNLWVTDYANNRVVEFNEKGEFTKALGFGVSNGESKLQTCTTGCRAGIAGSANGQFSGDAYDAFSSGNLYVTDLNNSRVEVFGPAGEYLRQFGSKGSGNGQFSIPAGIALDSHGNVFVDDLGNNRIEELTSSGTFIAAFGSNGTGNGQMSSPLGIAIGSTGVVYVMDSGNERVENWATAPNPGNEGSNDSRTTYYTAAANAEYPNCGGHPEWANLPCQTEPDVQPGDSGPPALPVTSTTYNIWDEPETITEKIGAVTRTSKKTFDAAGRETASEESSTSEENAGVPPVTYEYNSETGALVKESETLEGKVRTITSAYNSLGQVTSYTDAGGSTTKYFYDVDGRIEEVSEPKGRQVYAYDTTTGFLTKLFDTAAGTFTATYDVSGAMLTEGYPNGMVAKYTDNTIGQVTGLEYEKTTHCTEKCVWFSDTEAYGQGGELMSQASTLSSENYSYNEYGQLTQTQETPVGGKGCITRLYTYNEESERENSTVREPNEKGECTTEGGVVEGHFYDAVGRLVDPGVSYDVLGNIAKVPAVDAGGTAITSSFYVDNQVATQQQGEKTIEYSYDPTGRIIVSKLKGKSSSTTSMPHYPGPGNALTWTCEEAGECKTEAESKWTRDIPGIDGGLDAIQVNGGPAELELHDLAGNIVAVASLSETATSLLSTYNNTEFGVSAGTVTKYSWLGAAGEGSELDTGVITTAGSTYVPQLATTLQVNGVTPPGAAPEGTGPGELYRTHESNLAIESGNEGASNTLAEQRALEQETIEAEINSEIESAGEGVDPIYYMDPEETRREGVIALGINTAAKWIDFVIAAPDGIIKYLEGLLTDHYSGAEKAVDWFKVAGKELIHCSEESPICRFQYWEIHVKTPILKLYNPFFGRIETIGEFNGSFVNVNIPSSVQWCIGEIVKHPKGCYNFKKNGQT
jgi:YD repeat-containing protein